MQIYNLRKIKSVIYKMKLKQYIFCAYFLFLIFPMDIRGQEPEISTPNNYIIIKFRDDMDPIEYENGFDSDSIPSRKGVNYLIQEEYRYEFNESLIIRPNDTIEIHFYNNIKSLDNFFNGNKDNYCRSIIYVDLSHFDSSLVMNTESMFSSCDRLEEINFTNFDTSSVTNMENMFFDCSSLKSLELSHFDTSKVENMGYIFCRCESLMSLDLSNFDTPKLTNRDKMFYGLSSIKYINIYNITNNRIIQEIQWSEDLNKDDISVCQKKRIITNPNANYICDNSTNYIIIKYNESMSYSLFNDNCPERNKIGYIKNQNSILKVNDIILIEENKPIKIYFHNPIESLENFFNSDIDSNSKKIII